MRGVKDKASVLEIYRQQVLPSVTNQSSTESPIHRPSISSSSSLLPASPQHEISKIARLERMLKSRRLIS